MVQPASQQVSVLEVLSALTPVWARGFRLYQIPDRLSDELFLQDAETKRTECSPDTLRIHYSTPLSQVLTPN